MFRLTYEQVLAYALRRTDRADAEDVVAETYAVAWRRFDVVPADPLPWLYAVARRTLANTRRSVRRRTLLVSRLTRWFGPAAFVESDPGERLESTAIMLAALGALSAQDRETLMLIAWEGLDNERASAVFGISRHLFATRLSRARQHLQGQIDRLSGEPPSAEPEAV
jgi:RNA polymerase sigma-70 factor (ECF subfamily)